MRVPTGLQTATATASSTRFVQFFCNECGSRNMVPYRLSASAERTTHVFQFAETKERAAMEARQEAAMIATQKDNWLFYEFNINKNYENTSKEITRIKCTQCSCVQPWSAIPQKWYKSKRIWLLEIILLFGMNIAFLALDENGRMHPVIGLIYILFMIALLSVAPIVQTVRRKRAFDELKKMQVPSPVYYNEQNIQGLIQDKNPQPHTAVRASLYCKQCGIPVDPKANYCFRCGHSVQ